MMEVKIIDGKAISAEIRSELVVKTEKVKKELGVVPGLSVIMVGDDLASAVYVRNKEKACAELGFRSELYKLSADVSEVEIAELIDRLNADSNVHGILIQLPLPRGINSKELINRILPEKDVDAFNPYNIGLISTGNYGFLPCTPAGIIELLSRSGIGIAGKRCVVIGRSNIVGKPMAMLMLNADATVTVCHSKTRDLASICREADILISAVGKAGFVTADMVKEGAVVIDVGMNRNAEGKLCGDVDFAAVAPKTSYITPVPGGVGPMTITMLMRNTLYSALHSCGAEGYSI